MQQELIKKGVALVEFLTNNSCIKNKEANIHGRDQLTTCERGARSSDNNHLSAGDGGARTAGSPRLIPRWPSPSSSSNTCAPESTPSADSIGDGTGESPCGCGGGGVSLGGILSESQGRAEGVKDTKGRQRCSLSRIPHEQQCSLSSTNSRNSQRRRNPRAGRRARRLV